MSDDLNTPWYVFPVSREDASVITSAGVFLIPTVHPELAAQIVRVVNSHDALVTALTSARNRLRYLLYQDDGQSYKEAERAMPEIEAALAKAQGGKE